MREKRKKFTPWSRRDITNWPGPRQSEKKNQAKNNEDTIT